jgi:hypothetical protein
VVLGFKRQRALCPFTTNRKAFLLYKKIALALVALLAFGFLAIGGTGAAIATPVSSSASGTTTVTTDASGYATIPHDLGSVPNSVIATSKSPLLVGDVAVDSFTATNFRVRAWGANGTVIASKSITVSWAVFAGPAATTPPPTTTPATSNPPTTAPTTPPTTSPPATDFPDASNTGVPSGVTLAAYTGPMTINSNTTIDSKDISGCLLVTGGVVTIKNSKIHGDCFYVVDATAPATLTIQDSDIACLTSAGNPMNGTAIGEENFTANRVNVHSCENGFDINGNSAISDSYIHDLFQSGEAHTDGAQLVAGAHDVNFQHNTIYSGTNTNGTIVNGTSSIMTRELQYGQVKNITINNNLLSGGAYALYCQQQGKASNQVVTNNRFSTKFASKGGVYGPWTDCEDETHSGNKWYESGVALD